MKRRNECHPPCHSNHKLQNSNRNMRFCRLRSHRLPFLAECWIMQQKPTHTAQLQQSVHIIFKYKKLNLIILCLFVNKRKAPNKCTFSARFFPSFYLCATLISLWLLHPIAYRPPHHPKTHVSLLFSVVLFQSLLLSLSFRRHSFIE